MVAVDQQQDQELVGPLKYKFIFFISITLFSKPTLDSLRERLNSMPEEIWDHNFDGNTNKYVIYAISDISGMLISEFGLRFSVENVTEVLDSIQ